MLTTALKSNGAVAENLENSRKGKTKNTLAALRKQ
jgi:hypothetical protein